MSRFAAFPTLGAGSLACPLPLGSVALRRAFPVVTTNGESVRRLAAMTVAYRDRGGVATGEEVSRMLRRYGADQPLSRLARWIVVRDVVSIDLHGTTWLPLFQFEASDMSLRQETVAVTRELAEAFDDWELISWFAAPNTWLGGVAPVDALERRAADVLAAARADRFIACG